MGQKVNKISKNIMRRVYYTYALRLALHRYTLHGVFMVGLLYLLGVFVHVRAVIENFAAIQVQEIDTFVYSMLTHTEAWTLLTFVALLILVASFVRNLLLYKPQRLHFA